MEKCFILTTYCDTEEKINSLKDTLQKIKKYNYGVIVYSHYPVDVEIQNMCNYVVYDYSNPIFSHTDGRRAIINWTIPANVPFKFSSLIDDYGYAVIQQIKRGVLKARSLGYDTAIVLNYDTKFLDEVLIEAEEALEIYDGYFLDFSDTVTPAYYLPFFAIKIDNFIDKINQIDIHHYLSNIGDLMAEGYFAKLVSGKNIKVIPRIDWDNIGRVWADVIFINNFFRRYLNNKCDFFIGLEKFLRDDDDDKIIFICYSVMSDFEIKFEYDSDVIYSSKVIKDENLYEYLPISFSKLDVNKLKIYADDVEVYKEYKRNIKTSSIEKM